MTAIHHALVLNLHQPSGNLENLLDEANWEAREILFAMDRIPRALWGWEDLGRVHLSMSGTLLETLSNNAFQERVYGTVDCGALLWHLQNDKIINILGTGFYHPVLPLIPQSDRKEHLERWKGLASHLFWRDGFNGFWPPEMGFSMELIPLLKSLGYRYVLVDSDHVAPANGSMEWQDLRYRPHIARHEGDEIVVVVRDRELSDAQESGMDFGWFENELVERTRWCDFEPLVTTCTDGDNGGWFRNTNWQSNFWGAFYEPLLTAARDDTGPIRPTFIDDYLDRFGTFGEVTVGTGAWNTGWHHGHGFTQWTGSDLQKAALARLPDISKSVHDARWTAYEQGLHDPALHHELEESMWRLLRAETSCNVYWGEAWVDRCEADLEESLVHLARAQALMGSD
ncbi:glycoside hydrolase family 57 [Magnetospira sp. QH-2]|uniref:glycoside hydrolase family 57 n=1 Tax=Magnetospira sp. (strain QH-2) TaxID=1288970 RepID=UPI0003E80B4C|nr:glycoside hydrolase family 57 [Magnetospira sp. QH-2]CCQ73027.1 GH57 : distantly related to 4-a-glucanotransferase / amylomaltase [Magnetospira sp. QH-2]